MTAERLISIAGRRIGAGNPPYVIAEISANHNGDIERARQLIAAAAACGADAVKIQTYRPDTITLNCSDEAFVIRGGLWDGWTLYDLYQAAHLPWDWHAPLFDTARQLGVTLFSTPFDTSAVDLLEDLGAPAYKIASFEAVDLPLIRYAATTGKPMIISTGMADADEIGAAVEAARSSGCRELMLLHCVSGYPAPAADYHLRTIADMEQRFDVVVGLSDHTLEPVVAIAAVALGAAAIEKHFTLDRNGGGPDDSFSLEPAGLRTLCDGARAVWSALGRVNYERKPSERGNQQFRRSLYFVSDLKAGDTVTAGAVRSVRPGFGAAPKYLDQVLGRRLLRDIRANTPVQLQDLE